MLILAAVWFVVIAYRAVCLVTNHHKKRGVKLYQVIDLLCDMCLGIILLLWGLSINNIIVIDVLTAAIPVALYMIGKFFVYRLKWQDQNVK